MVEKETAIERAARAWNLDEKADALKAEAEKMIMTRLQGGFKSLSEPAIQAAADKLNNVGVPTLLSFFEPAKLERLKTEAQFLPLLGAAYKLVALGIIKK